jgi:hypothetical protein
VYLELFCQGEKNADILSWNGHLSVIHEVDQRHQVLVPDTQQIYHTRKYKLDRMCLVLVTLLFNRKNGNSSLTTTKVVPYLVGNGTGRVGK